MAAAQSQGYRGGFLGLIMFELDVLIFRAGAEILG
jgi:hypothetical protein